MDVTVVINGHTEGYLIAQAIRSARAAMAEASIRKMSCELLLVLDQSDEETRSIAKAMLCEEDRLVTVNVGDPSKARNIGVADARGAALALLDGDDMFGRTWLADGFKALDQHGFGEVCLHPEATVIFGEERVIWHHIGADHPDFRPKHLMFENYFTCLSLAPTDVYRRAPFRPNAFEQGFGHEDWAFVKDTMHQGVRHLVVPGTLHVVRRKRSSRLVESRRLDLLAHPTPLFSGRDIRAGPDREPSLARPDAN